MLNAKKGSKTHFALDTLGHLLALYVIPANEQDRAQVEELARQVQEVTEQLVELDFVDQGYTGKVAAEAAQTEGLRSERIKLPEAKKGPPSAAKLGRGAEFRPGSTVPPFGTRL